MIPHTDDDPARQFSFVTWALIALCIAVYVWEERLGLDMPDAFNAYGFVPKSLMSPQFLPGEDHLPSFVTMITSMFLHGGIWHLFGNMLYLLIFGQAIEQAMGHARYLLFYLISGLAAAMTMAFMDPASGIPMIGASGAISGLLGAYMLLHPKAQVRVLIPIGIIFYPLRIAAVWATGLWFAMQLLSAATATPDSPGVAWWAHIGGFVAGMVLTPFLKSANTEIFGPRHRRSPWA